MVIASIRNNAAYIRISARAIHAAGRIRRDGEVASQGGKRTAAAALKAVG